MSKIGPIATAILLATLSTSSAPEQIPGVKGTLILVEKDAGNANQADKLEAVVGDKIEITWSYSVVPGAIPTLVSAKSNSPSVRFEEIRSISRPKVRGSATLGAFFVAEKEGKAILNFVVKTGPETGTILRCEVEVGH